MSAPSLVMADDGEKCAQVLEKPSRRELRGYGILVGTMVASAAVTTYVGANLPPNWQFVSHFLAQASALGIYAFGAPIWEPLASAFRKKAFGVRGAKAVIEGDGLDPEFEKHWRRTQESFSLNAQMSRNVVSQFLLAAQQNFYEAFRAMQSDNPVYAADQIANVAFRLRTLFKDVDPLQPSVAAAVRTAFTNHVIVDAAFIRLIEERIQALDETYSLSPEARDFYQQVLAVWLLSNDFR